MWNPKWLDLEFGNLGTLGWESYERYLFGVTWMGNYKIYYNE
jgi:hypothetical protein